MKSKDVLLLCHAGAKGERKYSSYSFLTSAIHGSKWSECHPGYKLPQVKGPWYRLDRKVGLGMAGQVWIQRLEKKSYSSARN
jgi:hypothetical protein